MANFPPRFGWGFFRDLIDWTSATSTTYGNPQIKAQYLKLASDAVVSVAPAVTAFAGGGQGSATALTADFSNVTTVATAGDSVKLPLAVTGATYTVKNNGANNLAVFPNTSDTINGGSANASITLFPGTEMTFTAISAVNWQSNVVVAGTSFTSTTGITAFAGGGQASAVALTTYFNNITTCATAGDSVKLMAAAAGSIQVVKNSGATALDIFPAASDSIDALAINLAVRIQPGSTATFYAKDAIVWESSIDETITVVAPTTNTGALVLKATPSAGNFTTTVTNASQAAARVYTIPDAGAAASFAMTEGAQTINGIKTFGGQTVHAAGNVNAPGLVIGANDNGFYEVSSTQTGISIANTLICLWDSAISGLKINAIKELVTDAGVYVQNFYHKGGIGISNPTPVAINVTAAATAAQIVSGYITSTSAAAVAITTPTATDIAGLIGAVRGTSFDLVIDNSLGANTVTLTLDASIAVVTPALTGGDTLTVTTGNAVGVFRIVFISGTAAKIFRIG